LSNTKPLTVIVEICPNIIFGNKKEWYRVKVLLS